MEILEYGDPGKDKIILIHGFESPYQIWDEYIKYYSKYYCVIVPVLTGHNPKIKEDFVSFELSAKEVEDYYIDRHGNRVYALYGMSMGGVLASYIWINKRIKIDKLILESSPLLSYGKLMTNILTKQYLSVTHKARKRDIKTVKRAVNSMVSEDMLEIFLELLDHISDVTIRNYINEVGRFKLPEDINTPATKVYYYYGSTMNEFIFRKVAEYLKKNYINAHIVCLKGKGHCEDALLNPMKHIKELNKILIEKDVIAE